MKRIIPRNTKVSTEFFQGVSLTDILVGFFGALVVLLILLSNLQGSFWIGMGLSMVVIFLLLRLDDDPNYALIFRILKHYSYHRGYRNPNAPQPQPLEDDSEEYAQTVSRQVEESEEPEFEETLAELPPEERDEAIINYLFDPENPDLRAEDPEKPPVKEGLKKGLHQARLQHAQKKQNRRREKDENWLLKQKDVPLHEKEYILARQKRRAEVNYYNQQIRIQQKRRADIHKISPVEAIQEGFICYNGSHGSYYGAAIEIPAVEFRFFSEHRRNNAINNALGRVVRMASPNLSTNLVKIERPMVLDAHIQEEYAKLELLRTSFENGVLGEEEMKARVELIFSRIDQLEQMNQDSKILTPHYYMVFYNTDKRQLNIQVNDALTSLESGEMHPHRLNDRELALFLKYNNGVDFDEREIDQLTPEEYPEFILPSSLEFTPRTTRVNNIITHNFRVNKYPLLVEDAWTAELFDHPGTKVMVKFSMMDQEKSIRAIDRSISELRSRLEKTDVSSRVLELQTHIDTLQELLTLLNNSNESLIAVNIYVTAYDIHATRANKLLVPQPPISSLPVIGSMKKAVRRTFTDDGFKLNDLLFQQFEGYIGGQVNGYDPMLKEARGMPGSTVAAMFPWIYSSIQDETGFTLGGSDGVPTFIDFFRRDQERVNSNMVVVGKSGGGKSYAVKSILANLAADNSKIFVLDPENEYTELASNLNGKYINVANSTQGRINPFHILTTLEDDELEEGQETSSYAAHLQFLEEFFHQILPEVNSDAMEYLNNLVNRVYAQKGIDQYTNLSHLKPEDYPTFDDLYDCVLEEFTRADSNYIRSNLRVLVNYIAKFSTGGRNANIWNGPSTLDTLENFIVFNFQTLLSNRNNTIANAQMLLVLKYLDNEIIKNRDYNLKNRANRRIIVVIDEAHVFIDSKYPIALDFMYQLAKRIRKYNGMQIVITQNIKDFVGSEELARKSTAIINACQYSFIFSLAPNDMSDLCTLYEKAGGINEQEQEQIVNAARGQAFVVTGPSSRTTMRIQTPPEIEGMFTDGSYMAGLETTPEEQEEWEKLIGESREKRKLNLPATPAPTVPQQTAPDTDSVLLVEEPEEETVPENKVQLIIEEEDEKDETALLSVPEATLTPTERKNNTERTLNALHETEQSGYFGPLSPQSLQQYGLDALVAEITSKMEQKYQEREARMREEITAQVLAQVGTAPAVPPAPETAPEPAPELDFSWLTPKEPDTPTVPDTAAPLQTVQDSVKPAPAAEEQPAPSETSLSDLMMEQEEKSMQFLFDQPETEEPAPAPEKPPEQTVTLRSLVEEYGQETPAQPEVPEISPAAPVPEEKPKWVTITLQELIARDEAARAVGAF